MNIGDTVLMNVSNAKWFLDHPDIYFSATSVDPEYETETFVHLVCAMGVPVHGKIIRESRTTDNCWLVKFRVGRSVAEYYCDRSMITKV